MRVRKSAAAALIALATTAGSVLVGPAANAATPTCVTNSGGGWTIGACLGNSGDSVGDDYYIQAHPSQVGECATWIETPLKHITPVKLWAPCPTSYFQDYNNIHVNSGTQVRAHIHVYDTSNNPIFDNMSQWYKAP